MKVTRLNESNILDECKMEELKEKLSALSDRRVTNEAVDTTDPIVESVRKYLEDLLEGLMDNRAVQTASDVPGYSTDWCSEDPVHSKAMAKLSAAAQRFIDAEMDVLFENYVSPITESIDDMDKRCEKCNTLLNDGGTCPKCDDGEEDYGDNDDEEVEECLTENTESIIVDHNISDNDIAEFDEETGNIKVDATIIPYEQNKLVTIEIDDYESSTIQQYRMIDCKDGLVELEWIAAPITEDLLTEGPIRNGLRKIKNFFNPSGAKNRSIKDHEKDEEKYRKRKAPPILARDFDTKSQGYRFYKGNTKNPKPMNYDQWMAAYGRDDLTEEEYAEWYNAKVTDEHGFYIRRGSEDLRHKHITYQPGKNDEVLKMYRVGDGIDKEDEPDPIPEPPEDPEEKKKKKKKPGEEEEDPEDKKKKKKKKGDGEEEEDEEEEDPKPPRDKGKLKDDLRRFKQLCKLTSLRVLNAEKQLMNIKEIYSQIHVDNINNYKVKLNSSIVPLPAWLDRAAREKFLPALLKASGVSESLAEMYLSEDFFKRYDFTTVGDVLEGMVNNADEKTIDSDLRLFKQIAKKLSIADMDDVVVYVDGEYLYHPSQYTDLSYLALDHISDNDIRDCVAYNCGGIDFFVQNKNGLTFLFFRSEDDGEEYLELVDEINQF